MEKEFYFTYGAEGHPHVGGWTKVIANSREEAIKLWTLAYPTCVEKHGYLKIASIYSEGEFAKTRMATAGNFGTFCWDIIKLEHKILVNDKEVTNGTEED